MHHMEHIWTIVMLEIWKHTFYRYLLRIWKNDAIYAYYPESFCDNNLAIRKVFAFSDSGDVTDHLKPGTMAEIGSGGMRRTAYPESLSPKVQHWLRATRYAGIVKIEFTNSNTRGHSKIADHSWLEVLSRQGVGKSQSWSNTDGILGIDQTARASHR